VRRGAALSQRALYPAGSGRAPRLRMTAGTDEVAAGAAGGAAKRAPRPTVHWTADGRADVLRLFDQGALVHVAAPMVRYSKYAPCASPVRCPPRRLR